MTRERQSLRGKITSVRDHLSLVQASTARCNTSTDQHVSTALKAPARNVKSKARYHPIGRRFCIGNLETLPKRISALEINRHFLSHRLRSYYAQCSTIAASKPSFAAA
jgi:hypothetical protein